MISNLQHARKIAVLDVYGFQTCFVSAASAFENIELGYIHCALKENFNVTLKGFTCVSLICRELLVHSVATKQKVVRLGTDKFHQENRKHGCLPFIKKFWKFWLGMFGP